MKRKSYTVATADGPDQVSGLVTDCGLVGVHKNSNRYAPDFGLFAVTHVPSGWRLLLCTAHRHAREVALEVAKLEGLDVNTPAELAKVPGLAELLKPHRAF